MEFLYRLMGRGTDSISSVETQARLEKQPAPFVLDVRQPVEYQAGHIPGATLIPLAQLQQRLQKLPRDRQIVCVCRSGNRSATATRQLAAAGFNAVNMRGGMLDWQRQGLPLKKGKAK